MKSWKCKEEYEDKIWVMSVSWRFWWVVWNFVSLLSALKWDLLMWKVVTIKIGGLIILIKGYENIEIIEIVKVVFGKECG